MRKIFALVLVFACLLGTAGCMNQTYELPHDQFCYSARDAQPYELSAADKQYIIDILNSASWVNDLSNCGADFVFYTQKQEVRYHSECGTFTDYTNKKTMTVSEEQCHTINSMLGIV